MVKILLFTVAEKPKQSDIQQNFPLNSKPSGHLHHYDLPKTGV